MKLLAATFTSLVLLTSASAQTDQAGTNPTSSVQDSQTITIARSGSQPSRQGPPRDNGVTQDELIEAITHLAFYAGWPSAVTAIGVANEVFQKK